MKNLTKKQFIEDATALLRSRKIFVDSSVTNNISLAYDLYREIIEDKDSVGVATKAASVCPVCKRDALVVIRPCGYFGAHEYCNKCDYQKFF